MNGVNQKNLGSFFPIWSDMPAAQLLIETGKSDKDVTKIILSKFLKAPEDEKKLKNLKLQAIQGVNTQ
ncbi:MAG: hypothetical protein GY850_01595 [bacterium]|nr:hypothetical protein [bacterium]